MRTENAIRLVWSFLFLGLMSFVSCSQAENKLCIEGLWECNIISPPVRGGETLQLFSDSTIIVTDSIYYTASSDKLNVGIKAKVTNRGKWYINNDSIIVSFAGAVISLYPDSFVVRAIESSDSIVPIENDVMRAEFIAAIKEELKETYKEGVAYNGTLGKISMLNSHSFSLINGKSEMTYNRK